LNPEPINGYKSIISLGVSKRRLTKIPNPKHQKSNFKQIPMIKFKIPNESTGDCGKRKIGDGERG
jgi:hypothetical protein